MKEIIQSKEGVRFLNMGQIIIEAARPHWIDGVRTVPEPKVGTNVVVIWEGGQILNEDCFKFFEVDGEDLIETKFLIFNLDRAKLFLRETRVFSSVEIGSAAEIMNGFVVCRVRVSDTDCTRHLNHRPLRSSDITFGNANIRSKSPMKKAMLSSP